MNLREQMPETYAFIEAMRDAFGKDHINAPIKLGMQGAKTFHAVEGGFEVGTADHDFDNIPRSISLANMVLRDKQSEEKKNGK